MSTPATASQAFKNVTSAGTEEAIGASTTRFNKIVFLAKKSQGVENTGNVLIRPAGSTPFDVLAPGEEILWEAPNGSHYTLATFEVDAATSGDGVLYKTGSAIVYDGP